jgi:hypothetical protein
MHSAWFYRPSIGVKRWQQKISVNGPRSVKKFDKDELGNPLTIQSLSITLWQSSFFFIGLGFELRTGALLLEPYL